MLYYGYDNDDNDDGGNKKLKIYSTLRYSLKNHSKLTQISWFVTSYITAMTTFITTITIYIKSLTINLRRRKNNFKTWTW